MNRKLIYIKKSASNLSDFSWVGRDILVTDSLDINEVESGSIVLFEGGCSYPSFKIKDRTDLIIGSWGCPAVINGEDENGIELQNCSRVELFGLRVRGNGWRNNKQGIGVNLRGCNNANVRNIEVYGFRNAGISVHSSDDVLIEGCYAHDNGFCGICTDIHENFNRRISIRHCKVYDNAGDPDIRDNHSGSGIALFHTDGGLVEYCDVAGNGWAQRQRNINGPVGVWCACDCKNIIFRKNISRRNCTQPGGVDGDGFDIDGAVVGGLMEYNYSYENEGSGYLFCEYGSGLDWHSNHMRCCVSLDDGIRVERQGAVQFFGPEGIPIKDSVTDSCLLAPARGHHCVVNDELGMGCTGLLIQNSVLVEGSVGAIKAPQSPYTAFRDNTIIADTNIYSRLIKDSPRFSDPRLLDALPLWQHLEDKTLPAALETGSVEELFSTSELQGKFKLPDDAHHVFTYYLNGRDFEGSDYIGNPKIRYDHITQTMALELKCGENIHFPYPMWYEAEHHVAVLKVRLRSSDTKACIYISEKGKTIAVASIESEAGDYALVPVYFTALSEAPEIGIEVMSGEGGVLAQSVAIYSLKYPAEFRQSFPVRTYGDVYHKQSAKSSLLLNGAGSGFIRNYPGGGAMLETDVEIGFGGGILYVTSDGIYTEYPLAQGRKTYKIPLPGKGKEVSIGLWNGGLSQKGIVTVYSFIVS